MQTKASLLNDLRGVLRLLGICLTALTLAVCGATPAVADERTDLLAHRVGFGAAATGGLSGPDCLVTNLNASGTNSLRACAEDPNPQWIKFAVSGTIGLTSSINLGSNKTIDGRGADITLTSTAGSHTILINNKSNIIIHNIALNDCRLNNTSVDCIAMLFGTTDVWIDHVTCDDAGDECFSTYQGAFGITISWSNIKNANPQHPMGVLLGSQNTDTTVTMHHNYWHGSYERLPKINVGKLHQFNDYLVGWVNAGSQSSTGAQVFFENNVCGAVSHIGCAGSSGTPGNVKAAGNLLLNGAVVVESNPSAVFTPPYRYLLDTADESLRLRIIAGAGRQDVPTW